MPTVAPAPLLAPPIAAPFAAAAVGDAFAALFQQLAGPVAAPEGPAVAGGAGPAAGGAVTPAQPEETDPPTTTDAAPVPPFPAIPPPAFEPVTSPAGPLAVASSAAATGVPSRSTVMRAAPPVPGDGQEPPAARLVTHPAELGVEPATSERAAATADPAPPAMDPDPSAPARSPEAAVPAAAGDAPAPPRPSRHDVDPLAALPVQHTQAKPTGDRTAPALPPGPPASRARPASPAPSSPPANGRSGEEPRAATAVDGPPESAGTTISAERPPAARIDTPVEITARGPAGTGWAEAPRGPGSGPASLPSSGDLADAGAVRLAPQLTVAIVRQAADGLERVKVQLQPEELGAIEIALEVGDDGRARAAFLAERPETVDLLRREAGHLERALREVGVEVATGGMSFGSRDPHSGRDREPGTPLPVPPRDAAPAAVDQGPSRATPRPGASRLLDLTV